MSATAEDVCFIYDTSLNEPTIEAMLTTAETIIATYIDPLADARVTGTVRDQIKIWLGAHFCAIRDPQAKEESSDGIRTVFHGKSDLGLNATIYGQQAILIDPTGKLRKIDKGTKPLNFNFSEPRSEATDV